MFQNVFRMPHEDWISIFANVDTALGHTTILLAIVRSQRRQPQKCHACNNQRLSTKPPGATHNGFRLSPVTQFNEYLQINI